MEELLESGVHFGHQVHRWNPKMRPFIYGQKGGVHIFDLAQTVRRLGVVLEFVKKISLEGKTILFVGTKRQARDIIKEEAEKADSPYVNGRWLGGTLTNFSTIRKQIKKLNQLEEEQKGGKWDDLIKKERLSLERKLEKLKVNISGLEDLKDLPGALFVTDVNRDSLAVREAKKLGIPIIAICDTNSDPEGISYIIPANDDAIKSLRFLISQIANTIAENKSKRVTLSKKAGEEGTEKTLVKDKNKAKAIKK
jgi:small subunit ribosomal protein S2